MEFIESINVKGTDYQLQATYDSAGNKIVDVYATHTNVDDVVNSKIEALIGAAPEALDTLEELAKSLNDDANYAATVTTELAKKANATNVYTKSEIDTLELTLKSDSESKYNLLSGELINRFNQVYNDVYVKDQVYNKAEINAIADTKANVSDSYTREQLYTKTEIDTAFDTLKSELPTKVSAFENDSEYLVWSQVEHFAEAEAMNQALDGKVDKKPEYDLLHQSNIDKLTLLPTVDEYNAAMNTYSEKLATNQQILERVSAQLNEVLATNNEQSNQIAAKVDKVEGMGLSSNDYTAEDKELLQDLSGRVDALELATAVLEQFEALVAKVGELEAKIAELEAKHSENSEEPSDPEAEPEA